MQRKALPIGWSYFTHNGHTHFYSWGIMYLYEYMVNPEFQIFLHENLRIAVTLSKPFFSMEVPNILKR